MLIHFEHEVRSGIGCSSIDRLFTHIVDMPFLPPVGMSVSDGDWYCSVSGLEWDNGRIIASTEPNKTSRDRTKQEMDEIESELIEQGWERA